MPDQHIAGLRERGLVARVEQHGGGPERGDEEHKVLCDVRVGFVFWGVGGTGEGNVRMVGWLVCWGCWVDRATTASDRAEGRRHDATRPTILDKSPPPHLPTYTNTTQPHQTPVFTCFPACAPVSRKQRTVMLSAACSREMKLWRRLGTDAGSFPWEPCHLAK